jgi:hypothetical protein
MSKSARGFAIGCCVVLYVCVGIGAATATDGAPPCRATPYVTAVVRGLYWPEVLAVRFGAWIGNPKFDLEACPHSGDSK